jgi:hypothetical protein
VSRRTGILLFVLLAVVFLWMNRAAYRGYFLEDELDNLAWARSGSVGHYLEALLSPRPSPYNFRPVGHYYFHLCAVSFGLDFAKYVAVLQAIHLLNAWLVWLLLRAMGAPAFASGAATAVFALHAALFDCVWKPGYVFDVLCGTFCLLAMVFHWKGRWVLSFACFWLAYRSKEMAVLLPFVLLLGEFWLGRRRWKPLLPMLAAALSFGVQGMRLHAGKDTEYSLQFSLAALDTTVRYYGTLLLLAPYAAWVLPAVARNRRAWLGLAALALFFVPVLFLPKHLYSAYCYVPFIGLAVALAGIFENMRQPDVVLALALWTPFQLQSLNTQQKATLARAEAVRVWMRSLEEFAATRPPVDVVVYSGSPARLAWWGVEGAVRYLFPYGTRVRPVEAAGEAEERAALVHWDEGRGRLEVTCPWKPEGRPGGAAATH